MEFLLGLLIGFILGVFFILCFTDILANKVARKIVRVDDEDEGDWLTDPDFWKK